MPANKNMRRILCSLRKLGLIGDMLDGRGSHSQRVLGTSVPPPGSRGGGHVLSCRRYGGQQNHPEAGVVS